MYVGQETENCDCRPSSRDHLPQGVVAVALRVSQLGVFAQPLPNDVILNTYTIPC